MLAFILTAVIFFFLMEWFKDDGMPGCLAFVIVLGIMVLVWANAIFRILL